MILSFRKENLDIDFEFQIERIDIEHPTISIIFESPQDMHHFDKILKEINEDDKAISCGYDVEYTIQAPIEYLQGLNISIEV